MSAENKVIKQKDNDVFECNSINPGAKNAINQININSDDKFIFPKNPIEWKYKDEGTYHFKQDIERVWVIIRSFDLLCIIDNKDHLPCFTTKGNNFWKKGNEFKGCIFGLLPFYAHVDKSQNFPNIKKIRTTFYLTNNYYIKVYFTLYKVSDDNTTVFDWKVKASSTKYKEISHKYSFRDRMSNRICINIEKILEKEAFNLIQYESGTINGKMEDIWQTILKCDQLSLIAPNNNCLPSINILDLKIGEEVPVRYKNNNDSEVDLLIKLDERSEKPGWNKWVVIFSAFENGFQKHHLQTVIIQLTKVNQNIHQLCIITRFDRPCSCELFKELSQSKKYMLASIKDYFENFYSPISNNI